jgi:penicillin-binding protein 2
MLNRPSATWSVPEADRSRDWDPDRAPGVRLSLMWLGMLIPLVAVVVRMGQLQIMLQQDFADGFEQTYEVLEEIPARHGRILAADGSVLAGEDARYDLQMNYRLIQEPADERWLRGEALRNLDRVERKDKQKVAAEKERVLKRREELWEAVAKLTGRSSQELAETRLQVQNRVVQLRKDVLRQRAERQEQLNAKPVDSTVPASAGWASIWTQVRKELTEPPTRSLDAEPLIEEVGSHTIVSGVDADVKAEIEAHRERYPGLRIDVQTRRVYPQGELASHLIGSRTLLLADEAKKRQITEPESDW